MRFICWCMGKHILLIKLMYFFLFSNQNKRKGEKCRLPKKEFIFFQWKHGAHIAIRQFSNQNMLLIGKGVWFCYFSNQQNVLLLIGKVSSTELMFWYWILMVIHYLLSVMSISFYLSCPLLSLLKQLLLLSCWFSKLLARP